MTDTRKHIIAGSAIAVISYLFFRWLTDNQAIYILLPLFIVALAGTVRELYGKRTHGVWDNMDIIKTFWGGAMTILIIEIVSFAIK